MEILILFARRNAYLLDIAYQHAINKGGSVAKFEKTKHVYKL